MHADKEAQRGFNGTAVSSKEMKERQKLNTEGLEKVKMHVAEYLKRSARLGR